MNVQDTITFSITIDPATQLAANDYSYADTGTARSCRTITCC